MKRTLTLKKDTLTELGSAELGEVVGGTGTRYTCLPCLVDRVTTIFHDDIDLPSIDTPCS